MAMHNPKGRANYEPNSWPQPQGGARENPATGYRSFPQEQSGEKVRERSASFGDHYSQARQFYISQTPVEQTHMKDAFVFELSKVETPAIRVRMLTHLRNVDETLAHGVAEGLGISPLPPAARPFVPVRTDLPASDALSILKNGPDSFHGRKLGIVVTEGTDADLLGAVLEAAHDIGAETELVGPRIGNICNDRGKVLPVMQKINGGPSVLYDAVVLLPSAQGTRLLLGEATMRDFIADAFAHAKFIGYGADAEALLDAAGVTAGARDDGVIRLGGVGDAAAFVKACAALRFWQREPHVHAV